MSLECAFDWPPKALSPNARVGWQAKARWVAKYRRDCYLLAKAVGIKCTWEGAIVVSLIFCPPDKRHRDIDNAVSCLKAGIDGLADALRVDDSRFLITPAWGEPVKNGLVKVEIAP